MYACIYVAYICMQERSQTEIQEEATSQTIGKILVIWVIGQLKLHCLKKARGGNCLLLPSCSYAYVCMFVCISACMPVCMCACLHVCLLVCLPVCLSVCTIGPQAYTNHKGL